MAITDALDAIRQPAYTGENRCTPCTIVNLVIAAVVAGLVELATSALLGAVALAAAVAAIYLRGYLVPGTPRLTKRYLPDEVLRWFDKAPETDVGLGADVDPDEEVDPEETLLDLGVVEPNEAGTDLRLTPEFASAWRDHVERLRDDDALREALADLLDADADRVALSERGAALVATLGDSRVGQWPSRAALLADVAGDAVLVDRESDWTDLPLERRSALVGTVRLFVEECPVCDGPVRLEEETRESCCREWEVVALSCDDCDARLFEIEAEAIAAVE